MLRVAIGPLHESNGAISWREESRKTLFTQSREVPSVFEDPADGCITMQNELRQSRHRTMALLLPTNGRKRV